MQRGDSRGLARTSHTPPLVPGEAPPLALRSKAGRRQVGYTRRRPEESVLYGVVRDETETFLLRAGERERPAPRFVERELRSYLECGILAHGFVRVRCGACGCDRLVAFSCRGRGLCPSCGGRRMADTAAHLVDRVFPETPVPQWVLSLPFALRYRLGYDARLAGDVLQLFVRAIFASLRRRCTATPTTPSPSSSAVAGSGTGASAPPPESA